jgi:23S rRNA pseudouridine1911/1915/1917 synthase
VVDEAPPDEETPAASASADAVGSEDDGNPLPQPRQPFQPKRQPDEILLRFLEREAPEHFQSTAGEEVEEEGDDRLGVDAVLAAWEGAGSGAASLAGIVARASGLDAAMKPEPSDGDGDGDKKRVGKSGKGSNAMQRAMQDATRQGGKGGKSSKRDASAGVRGRAAGMFNVVLSALDIRGGAHEAALSLLYDYMPALGVAPDVVSYSLVAAACVHAGDDAAAGDVLAAARRAAGADKRANSKKKNKKGAGKKKGGKAAAAEEEEEQLRVLWEDEHIAAVCKPAGVLVHPTGGASSDKKSATLVDLLVARFGEDGFSGINGAEARGIVHRLDRPTSGVMLVARSDKAHALLVAAWYQRRVTKTYLALVEGVPGRPRRSRRTRSLAPGVGSGGGGDAAATADDVETEQLSGVVAADADGRPAKSSWRVKEIFGEEEEGDSDGGGGEATTETCSLVEVMPHTGRKHQVRQHMGLALDAPLVGDPLYRKGKSAHPPAAAAPLLRADKPGAVMFLHAAALELDHPVTGERLELRDPLPPAFDGLLAALRQ